MRDRYERFDRLGDMNRDFDERGDRDYSGRFDSMAQGWRGGESARGGAADHDADLDYRRWRDDYIRRLDQDYEEYCRTRHQERHKKFGEEFEKWRTSRPNDMSPMQSSATSASEKNAAKNTQQPKM